MKLPRLAVNKKAALILNVPGGVEHSKPAIFSAAFLVHHELGKNKFLPRNHMHARELGNLY